MIDIPQNDYNEQPLIDAVVERVVKKLNTGEDYCGILASSLGDYNNKVPNHIAYKVMDIFKSKGYYCYIAHGGDGHGINFKIMRKPLNYIGMLTSKY